MYLIIMIYSIILADPTDSNTFCCMI